MVRVKKVNNLENYSFKTVSRDGEYAVLNDGFADVFEMNNVETILDFAQKYFGDLTDRCTKWYIYTKNNSILACQKDLLLCKLTEGDYRMLQGTKLGQYITNNSRKRKEDINRPYLLEIHSLALVTELANNLRI